MTLCKHWEFPSGKTPAIHNFPERNLLASCLQHAIALGKNFKLQERCIYRNGISYIQRENERGGVLQTPLIGGDLYLVFSHCKVYADCRVYNGRGIAFVI